MEQWLIILIAILVSIAILVLLYFALVLRRIAIITKKADYLVEDLTYKSEKMNDVISAIVKISNYINAAEDLIKTNSDTINLIIEKNKKKDSKNKNLNDKNK